MKLYTPIAIRCLLVAGIFSAGIGAFWLVLQWLGDNMHLVGGGIFFLLYMVHRLGFVLMPWVQMGSSLCAAVFAIIAWCHKENRGKLVILLLIAVGFLVAALMTISYRYGQIAAGIPY